MIRRLALILLLCGLAAPVRAAQPIQAVVSPGGVAAWLVEDHANPMIAVSLLFRGGAADDPAGKEGLAHFASGMLDEGAGDLDSQAFQDRLDGLNVSLSFSASRDVFSAR
jgi:zinc protease